MQNNSHLQLFSVFTNDWIRNSGLDAYSFHIFIYLCSFNSCSPSYSKIMKDLEISRERIAKSIKVLELHGLIKKEKTKGKSNRYKIFRCL